VVSGGEGSGVRSRQKNNQAHNYQNYFTMLKNYFKTALRNLLKQKGLAFINIFGLSAGLACFGLFMLYALNEFSFDRFHKKGENIFRMYLGFYAQGDEPAGAITYNPVPLGPAMKQDFPDVENYVRFREPWGESFLKAGDNISRGEVSFADPSFFSVFSAVSPRAQSAENFNARMPSHIACPSVPKPRMMGSLKIG